MLQDLIRVLPAAILVGVLPGWFWTYVFLRSADRTKRLTYAVALSMILVPATALVPARFFGIGVTLSVAIFSTLLVFMSGLVAYLVFGRATDKDDEPLAQPPTLLGAPALMLLAAALGLALAALFGVVDASRTMFPIALLILFAGTVRMVEVRSLGTTPVPPSEQNITPRPALRGIVVWAVFGLVLLRGYLGPVLYDWPFLRGTDQFNHTVMANAMLEDGRYDEYLVYPPGLHTLDAAISRLSGLEPLDLFPVLAPAFLVLPSLALYALATRLWGWSYGVAAAAFGGLISGSSYANIAEARYPNLVSAEFLLVLAVAALVGLLHSPSRRNVLLFALLGSSVVLYHPVASLYAAVLFALAGLFFLPYLLLKQRATGLALLGSFVLLGLLSVLFAWDTYDLPGTISGVLSDAESGAGGAAVSQAIGTQEPLEISHLTVEITAPVLWLGLFGAVLVSLSTGGEERLPRRLSLAGLLLWALILFAGSRTAMSGFPERFERDLGIPLALFAAYALGALLRSLTRSGITATAAVALVAALLAVAGIGVQGLRNAEEVLRPPGTPLLTPGLAAAGEWLEEHNTGGSVVSPPYLNGLPNRTVLAMGGYTELQSYREERVRLARSLPPAGAEPLWDALWLLRHPGDGRSARIVNEYDVRYVFLNKENPSVDPRSFEERPDLYRVAFENEEAVIFAPLREP